MNISGFVGVLGFCLGLAGPALSASESDFADTQDRSRLTVLGGQAAASEAPRILRGSAIPRKAPEPEPVAGPERWQALAGRHLWLADPATREVVTCRLFTTTQIGERVVRCFKDDLPRTVAHD